MLFTFRNSKPNILYVFLFKPVHFLVCKAKTFH